MTRFALTLICGVMLASAAAAHPGHGEAGPGFDLAHYLTEPVHAVEALVVLVAFAAVCTLVSRRIGARAADIRRR